MSQNEFDTIDRYFRQAGLAFSKPGVVLGIGDDCALFSVPIGQQLALSMDILQQNIHFPAAADSYDIARRALAVNLSDLAAMGAEPLGFTLGLSMPSNDASWLDRFSAGLLSSAQQYNCPLVGGDLSRGPLSIVIQVHGLVAQGQAICRSGARSGDQLFVTGSLGDGAIALLLMNLDSHIAKYVKFESAQLNESNRNHFLNAYFNPTPRLELARAARHLISSGIDISDGLVGDLGHILKASAVGARIETEKLPLSQAMKDCVDSSGQITAALAGGDDYELCVTVAPEKSAEFCRLARELDVAVSCIGKIVDSLDSEPLKVFDAKGRQWDSLLQSYNHFNPEGH